MNEVSVFQNPQFGQVRTITRDGEPWFVANDVCRALDLTNPRKVISRLDADEKDGVTISDAIGREQKTNVVNESGLYTLILTSRKPEAHAFKRWVTHDILPSIRKTGSYSTPGVFPPKATSVSEVVKLIQETRQMMERQGCTPHDVAVAVDSICKQFGIMLPECFIKPETFSMQDWEDAVDWIFKVHPDSKSPSPTFQDYMIFRAKKRRMRLENPERRSIEG